MTSTNESSFLEKTKFRRLIPKKLRQCLGYDKIHMTKIEKTIKATLLIQSWYRRCLARLEMRRRCAWTIFQTLEYAGEQDQVKLYSLFNALLQHIPVTEEGNDPLENPQAGSVESLDFQFDDESPDGEDDLNGTSSSKKFVMPFPIQENDVTKLIQLFGKSHFRLTPLNLAGILKRAVDVLKELPNLNKATVTLSNQITICGDLHGKLDDLIVIFYKNGLPSIQNPYIFNGDFVDRGKKGLEVFVILLCCLLTFPGGVFLNRGNHEDSVMNTRYGFIKELQSKYKRNSERLLKLIEDVYRYLPLGTLIDKKILVVHGGITDTTDLDIIQRLDRSKYVSVLRPPVARNSIPGADLVNKLEWKQIFDILWSDPQLTNGCAPNGLRGAGSYFGPDVTKNFLDKNKLVYLIRSHECKPEGYEIAHDGKVITIFSASNYYEFGSNNGAYVKIVGPQFDTHFVRYMANSGRKKLTFKQRLGFVESGAVREIHRQIIKNKELIEQEFATMDPNNTGFITINEWCRALENGTGLQIPWRMLKDKLVQINNDTKEVKYETTFDIENHETDSIQGANSVVDTLYRNKQSLETIFRIMDKDNSGYISLDEFAEACKIIKEHMSSTMTEEELMNICQMMDLNKDGLVDLNEFLETFRMVDPQSKSRNKPVSPSDVKVITTDVPLSNETPMDSINPK